MERNVINIQKDSRVVEKLTKIVIGNDVLDSKSLRADEKCSGYRYLVYRLPTNAKLSKKEENDLRLILKQDLNKAERKNVIDTLREVHRRDELQYRELEATEALLHLTPPKWRTEAYKP